MFDFKIIEYLTIESKLQLSPIGGATKEKTSQRCEVFFGFIGHTFVKLSPFSLQTKVAMIKKLRFLIISKNISLIIPVVVYCLLKK